MDKVMSNIVFKLMSLMFKLRDFSLPRSNILKEVGLKTGFHVLDYGCGPGSYILPLAELVGKSGKIYALDIHPLAVKSIQDMITKKQLTNVEVIYSDCKTGLSDNSLDAVLLYDIFHGLTDPNGVLAELHRVLKKHGILSFYDHHMKENEIVPKVTDSGFFKLLRKGKRTHSFSKETGAKLRT